MVNEGNYSYNYLDTSLLDKAESDATKRTDHSEARRMADIIQRTFDDAKVGAKVVRTVVAPQMIQFEIRPERGVRFGKITALEAKFKEALAVGFIHIITSMLFCSNIAIQVPRKDREVVPFASLIASQAWKNSKKRIPLALGKDIYRKFRMIDLYKKQNLLIAGTEENDIKMCLDTLIASMLYKFSPDDLNLIMIDSKGDLNDYAKLPHLSMPLVKDADKALAVLESMVNEMERRFRLLAKINWGNDIDARHPSIMGYNRLVPKQSEILDDNGKPIPEKLPFTIIVIDDLADCMSTNRVNMDFGLAHLVQQGPQVGIYLIAATTRPTSKVITPMLRANCQTRIAFRCNKSEESKMLIDMDGAEALLGEGDMLLRANGCDLSRIQCASLSDAERSRIVDYVADNGNKP